MAVQIRNLPEIKKFSAWKNFRYHLQWWTLSWWNISSSNKWSKFILFSWSKWWKNHAKFTWENILPARNSPFMAHLISRYLLFPYWTMGPKLAVWLNTQYQYACRRFPSYTKIVCFKHKQKCGLDILINTLLKIARDNAFERLIKKEKGN